MQPKIFVSVANYRDPETSKTILDMMAKARYPERVSVGVHSQVDRKADIHCVAPAIPRVRQLFTHYKDSKGCCWARSKIIELLLEDEEFFFQIDSHTRFVQDWDEQALNEWKKCEDPKAYITHYPPGYMKDGTLSPLNYIRHKALRFMGNGIPVMGSAVSVLSTAPGKPARTPFFAGGCFFAPTEAVRSVPYDPYIYFEGEETSMAVRLFSNGYNGYSIRLPFIYHLYFQADNGRARHFEQNPDYVKLNQTSFARVRNLLDIVQCINPEYMRDYELYKLGSMRTLQQYEHFSGVYFKEQRFAQRALDGDYK